jgi:hypothetical protein
MTRAMVVELQQRRADWTVQPLARFVLPPDGPVRLVELAPNGRFVAEELIGRGLPEGEGLPGPADGAAFLAALPWRFAGVRLWATEPFEMDLDAALAGEPA